MAIIEALREMAAAKASDLFAFAGKRPSLKINGEMVLMEGYAPIDEAELDAFRRETLQPEAEEAFQKSGNFDTGLSLDAGSRHRVNFLMQQGLPGLVARLVPQGSLSFEELNLPKVLRRFADFPRGLIFIVGSAGSGKSTTMAAMLHHVNSSYRKHIITIEDPIEFVHDDLKCLVTQREVGADTASFADALRGALRESPDAIFVGETRDIETIRIGMAAALTGHLVVTTMHTADVVQCLERVINHYPEHLREQAAIDLSLALRAVVAQRLVLKADGTGRIPALEILEATPMAKNLIAARQFNEIEQVMRGGEEEGMVTFNRALADLCKAGAVTLEEGSTAATNSEELKLLVQGMETGIDTFRGAAADGADEDLLNMKRLLHSAIANSASDVILTVGARPTLRINGQLNGLALDPLGPADTKRLLFGVLTTHQRAKFEAEREIDFALSLSLKRKKDGRSDEALPYRFRVNGFYQRGNVAVSIRIIPTTIPSPEELMLPNALVKLTDKQQGLIVISGPTGHGKSTTMASLIDRINKTRACHIITVEDPIEYVHDNIKSVVEQREVYADTMSFGNALKYVLRQDPDVILVGEMRDTETISTALTAAETGHLVLATVHTNSAPESVNRIVDSFPANQQNQIRAQFSAALLGIVSQRLIPRRDGKGRIGAFEILVGTTGICATIRDGKTHTIPAMLETGAKDGMITMEKAVTELYTHNLISREEALKFIKSPQQRQDMRTL